MMTQRRARRSGKDDVDDMPANGNGSHLGPTKISRVLVMVAVAVDVVVAHCTKFQNNYLVMSKALYY